MTHDRAFGECAARGAWTTRANPLLVSVVVLETLLVGGLSIFGALLPVLALLDTRKLSDLLVLFEIRDVETAADLWLGLGSHFSADRMILGCLLAVAVWTLATLLWVFLQGIRWGAFAAADARGQHDCQVSFKVDSLRALANWGRRYFGRFFVFLNGYAVLISLVALGATLCFAWALRGGIVGTVLGASGILLLVLVALLLHLWFGLGRALLARPGSSVVSSSRSAWRVLWRRPLAVLALAVIATVAGLTVSSLAGVGLELLGLLGVPSGVILVGLLILLQVILGAYVAVWQGSTLTALSGTALSGTAVSGAALSGAALSGAALSAPGQLAEAASVGGVS